MKLKVVLAVLIGTLVLACSSAASAPAEPTPNIDATVEARAKQLVAAQATPTPYPTYTQAPKPTNTQPPRPTNTAVPQPTNTPTPTALPTPAPTPTPVMPNESRFKELLAEIGYPDGWTICADGSQLGPGRKKH